MRVLLLVDCYFPTIKSSAKQMRDLGVEFTRCGHDVILMAPCEGIRNKVQINIDEGVRVLRVKSKKIKGAPRFLRALREVQLSKTLWRNGRSFLEENPCDLIVYYSPTIFFGTLVGRLKSMWRCPAYLVLRDIFPQWALDAGLLRRGPIWWYFHRKEIEQYDVADKIAIQSPGNAEYFAKAFPSRKYPLEVLYNWTGLEEPGLPATNYRKTLGLEGKVVFFYGGNLGVAQDVDNIVRLALRLTAYRHIHVLLVGDGTEVPRLRRLLREEALHNIQILPPVHYREYLAMLFEFDVGLLSLDRRLRTHNVPGKLLGYLYCAKPILASINPGNDLFDTLHASDAGLCFKNGDDENLCAAALRLAHDADLRAKMGRNSRQLLEHRFSSEAAVQQIMTHLSRLGVCWDAHASAHHGEAITVGHNTSA